MEVFDELDATSGNVPTVRSAHSLSNAGERSVSSRSKLDAILDAAARRFGDVGFDRTRWADVARDVGIGPTALYHYFESKNHCLFVLVALAIAESNARFLALTSAATDTRSALEGAIRLSFDLSPAQVRRSRIIVTEQIRLTGHSNSEREEAARIEARSAMRVMDVNWRALIASAMAGDVVRPGDPELAMRSVLGLLASVWHWYRSDGPMSLSEIADGVTLASLRMLGVEGEGRPK